MGLRSRFARLGRDAGAGPGAHAVVVGAGMAGLLAARVLAGHFERVTLVERDRLPDRPGFRPGVPQSRHLHVLLGRGLECLEELFPGFEASLVEAGAPVIEGSESLWLNAAGWCRRYPSPIRLLGASRELVEWQARTRVAALDNLRVLEGCEVVGLLADRGRAAVTGVRLRSRGGRSAATGPDREVTADLVVDASGRGSRTPEWLAALGYPAPAQTSVDARLGYASRQYRIPAGWRADWRMLVVNAKPPGNPRTGGLVPIEGGRWMVALIGAGRDQPPTDEAGFLEFARGLRTPLLYEAIRDAEPLTPIHGFRNTDNRRRHFERLRRWPERFLAIGDASCTFNPIYAQGMTVTAMTAVALDRLLAERRPPGTDPLAGARSLQRRLARTSAGAWTMATTEDLRYPWTEGARPDLPTRVMHRYADRVLEVANGNRGVNSAFVDVVNLRRPPASLLRPGVLLPVLARHRAPPLTRPPTTRQAEAAPGGPGTRDGQHAPDRGH